MMNLDWQCQGGPEGEKYPKTTRIGKSTKKTKKEVWRSLVRASSSVQPTEEKKEEEEGVAIQSELVTAYFQCYF